jgi:hypothetical protein
MVEWDTMNKTTIYLPEALHRSLQGVARRSGRSQAHVIRDAIEQYVANEEPPQLTSIGVGDDPELDARDYEAWLEAHWTARDHD